MPVDSARGGTAFADADSALNGVGLGFRVYVLHGRDWADACNTHQGLSRCHLGLPH